MRYVSPPSADTHYSYCFFQSGVIRFPHSLAPGRFERNFREVIFKLILMIDGWGISCEIVLTWTPRVLTDEKSTLVHVMNWCHQPELEPMFDIKELVILHCQCLDHWSPNCAQSWYWPCSHRKFSFQLHIYRLVVFPHNSYSYNFEWHPPTDVSIMMSWRTTLLHWIGS